jgi:hypothetical protein
VSGRSTGRLTLYLFFLCERDLERDLCERYFFDLDLLSCVVSAGNNSVNSIVHLL